MSKLIMLWFAYAIIGKITNHFFEPPPVKLKPPPYHRPISKNMYKFKHQKYREAFRMRRYHRMRTIHENTTKEFLEDNNDDKCYTRYSPSDRVLNCLSRGLTIKQSFGTAATSRDLHRLPVTIPPEKIMKHFNVGAGFYKSSPPRRRLNFKSQWTDFISDLLTTSTYKNVINKII